MASIVGATQAEMAVSTALSSLNCWGAEEAEEEEEEEEEEDKEDEGSSKALHALNATADAIGGPNMRGARFPPPPLPFMLPEKY